MSQTVLFSRQPIYNKNHSIFGFELVNRTNDLLEKQGVSIRTNAEVLVNYCTGLVDNKGNLGSPIFLTIDENFINSGVFIPAPPESVILVICDSVKPTQQIINALLFYRRQGYKLALLNYSFEEDKNVFLPLVSILKIDVSNISSSTLSERLEQADLKGKKLLADNVADIEMYKVCRKLGFVLFQGDFLEKPTLIKGKNFTASKQSLLYLVSNLCRSDITLQEVSDLIATDPNLIVKILKIVNCPLYPFKREVTELKEAVVKLGLEVVKQWAVVLSLVAGSSQPSELFRTLLIRAKSCELYAQALKKDNPQEYFLMGLFSGIDAVLGVNMRDLLNTMHLPAHITQELLPKKRSKNGVLAVIMAFENKNSTQKIVLTEGTAAQLYKSYWNGLTWADDLMKFMT